MGPATGKAAWHGTAMALGLPWVALAVQWLLWPWINPFVWFLFFPTAFLAAALTNRRAAMLATVESVLIAWYFFMPPQLSWQINRPNNLYSMAVFLLMGLAFAETHHRIRGMRAKLEASLAESHRAEARINDLYRQTLELDELKTQFFANMSHEIRTPLNAILGLSYLVRKGTHDAQQVERLDKIAVSGTHLLSIINDILDFSKMEAGRMVLEQQNFPLHGLLDQVRSMSGEAAQKKGLRLEVDCQDVPAWIIGDPTRLRQALLNLVSNAIKFTERGHVVLRARPAGQRDDRVVLRFVVEDTGIGIGAAQLPQLFKPFRQADAATSRRFGGTGLGLAITQRLAVLMGGNVGVDSSPGVGSRFWMSIEAVPGEPQASEGDMQDDLRLREEFAGQRVLVVEDDAVNREVAFGLLTEVGLRVDLAEDGQRAIDMATANDYAMVLMDVQMPVMDGFAATRALRALPALASLPILAFTANVADDYRQRCLAAGMSDLVGKPVDPAALYAVMHRWLAQAQAASAQPGPAAAPAGPRTLGTLAIEQNLRTCLDDLPGLDAARGVANLGGRVKRYAELLEHFTGLKHQEVAHWQALLAQGRHADLLFILHAFKGAAGTLGLVECQQAAVAAEARLKSGDGGVEGELAVVRASLARVAERLRKLDFRHVDT